VPAAVAVVRCASYDTAEVEDAVLRSLDLLGGAGSFFPPGAGVLLKPNLLAPRRREARVTTDPEVVRALVGAAGPAAGPVTCGDSRAFAGAARTAAASGYNEVLAGTRARIVELDRATEVRGATFPRVAIARAAVAADVLVNVAKAKTHPLTGLTLAVKNLFGCVPGVGKPRWHLRARNDRARFARILVEIAAAARARLHVLDAVIGMEGNGPGSGTPRPIGAILASTDATALDRVACELVGFPPGAVTTLEAARRLGWGEPRFSKIDLAGEDIARLRLKGFRPAVSHGLGRLASSLHFLARPFVRFLSPEPVFDGDACTACGACVEVCPAGALAPRGGGAPRIDRDRCIRCFCCQEACPSGAVSARGGWLGRLLG
jgi:uncharacterized protein (DUF362 family)/ferredoxin